MAQTQLDYNSLMFGVKGEPFRYKSVTITGAAALLAGTIMVRASVGVFKSAVDADKQGAAEIPNDWAILLEDADPSGGDVPAKIGESGGVAEDKLIAGTGLANDADVTAKLAGSNIYVVSKTSSMAVAGEGA